VVSYKVVGVIVKATYALPEQLIRRIKVG
jgi:hypothetical protein